MALPLTCNLLKKVDQNFLAWFSIPSSRRFCALQTKQRLNLTRASTDSVKALFYLPALRQGRRGENFAILLFVDYLLNPKYNQQKHYKILKALSKYLSEYLVVPVHSCCKPIEKNLKLHLDFLMNKSVGDMVTIKGKIISIGEVLGYSINIDEIS